MRHRFITAAALLAALLLSQTLAFAQAPTPTPLAQAAGRVALAQSSARDRLDLELAHRRLDEARDDLILGAPAEAERALLAMGEPAQPAAATRWRLLLARAAMLQGRGQQALERLGPLRPEDTDAPAWFLWLKGQAQELAGLPDDAARSYEDAMQRAQGARLEHLARARRADALFAAKDPQAALTAQDDLLARYPEHPHRHIARYRRAQLLITLGRLPDAAHAMQQVWLDYPWKEEGEQARAALEQAPLIDHKPAPPSVPVLMARARDLRTFKHWLVAEQALQELLARVQTPSGASHTENELRMQLALVRYERQDYDVALERLADLEQRAQTRGLGAGLSLDFIQTLQHRALLRKGDAPAAEAALKKQLARRGAKAGHAELAEFYWDVGDYKNAKKYKDFVVKGAQRNTWDYAFLTFKAGDHAQALRLMQKASGVPQEQSLYWQSRALHELGQLDKARALYERVAKNFPLTYYAYQARNRLIELDEQESQRRVSGAPAGAPLASLGVLESASVDPDCACTAADASPAPLDAPPARPARIHWRGHEEDPAPERGAGFGAAPDDARDAARMRPYLTSRPLQGAARRAADAHADLWPRLREVAFLFDLGLEGEAREELREVTLELRGLDEGRARPSANRPVALPYKRWAHYIDHRGAARRGFWGMTSSEPRYPVPKAATARRALAERQLAIHQRRQTLREDLREVMMEVGDFHFVRKMRLGDGPWWRHDPAGDHRERWSEAYPRAFPEYVQRYAAKEGLNPYLLWALMTVESAYNPDSVSYADARGLLQVIPKTGGKVAADIGEGRYGHYDLMDPETSIRHGAWYFARLVKKFQGQEPLAIASYNGGPHNVQRWLIHKDHANLDEFIEEIPFDQARGYTKKVLRFLALFLRLYEGTDALYLGQDLSKDILTDPRY
jgi:soluble lytic murein transglycosylase-like protein